MRGSRLEVSYANDPSKDKNESLHIHAMMTMMSRSSTCTSSDTTVNGRVRMVMTIRSLSSVQVRVAETVVQVVDPLCHHPSILQHGTVWRECGTPATVEQCC